MAQRIIERDLSRDELIALKNKRTGMTIFQLSWILVFVCLLVVNWQIRGNFTSWPPEGVARLDWLLPTIATALLLVSGWTVRGALKSIEADALPAFLRQWRWTLLLGVAFIVLMCIDWVRVNDAGQYGALARVMIAFHAFHALVIGIYMWSVQRRAVAGLINARDTWAVEAGAKLWYFVVVAWIMFYVALYVL
jgi:heme/copper-type cytochrome/quinol oxidase subunit 3